jgi:SAM-dependent methyltransferase
MPPVALLIRPAICLPVIIWPACFRRCRFKLKPLVPTRRAMTHDDLPFSAAADRNKEPILAVLRQVLPRAAMVLEIASGTGQHAAHFAAAEPGWQWQPTDAQHAALPGIAARCAGLRNVQPPLWLDVLAHPWAPAPGVFDAVYCANMLHVSPSATCAALMQGAARHLHAGGALLLYGPYIVDGEPTAPSNLAFDADLRARNATWGLRRLAEVLHQAETAGIAFDRRFNMQANNLMLVFRRSA